jgi:hypothetical protein
MEMKKYNAAQMLLISIGGIAELVAGYGGHYFADSETPKKTHKRSRVGRGNYGRNLMSSFDDKRCKTPRNLRNSLV